MSSFSQLLKAINDRLGATKLVPTGGHVDGAYVALPLLRLELRPELRGVVEPNFGCDYDMELLQRIGGASSRALELVEEQDDDGWQDGLALAHYALDPEHGSLISERLDDAPRLRSDDRRWLVDVLCGKTADAPRAAAQDALERIAADAARRVSVEEVSSFLRQRFDGAVASARIVSGTAEGWSVDENGIHHLVRVTRQRDQGRSQRQINHETSTDSGRTLTRVSYTYDTEASTWHAVDERGSRGSYAPDARELQAVIRAVIGAPGFSPADDAELLPSDG